MNTRYCYGCMRPLEREDHMCGTCGFDAFTYKAEPHQLHPGVVLHDRYLIGKVLGEGGFGITYVGRDTLLDRKVAIKEFYMKGFVNRNTTASLDVSASVGTDAELFERNREKFLDEARVLARFDREAGIVRIQDFFEENNTAYMVMEFLEGKTLRDHLKETGKMMPERTISIMRPVMHSLHAVHKQNIIHRDISPDNIMVLDDGRVQLLDFGAAREASKGDVRSLSVILKPGYAPEEQYRSKGKQGPWTDVYALCATMYRCISGIVPDESMERMFEDKLQPLSKVSNCPESVSSVIMKGLCVRQDGRYQSVDQLQKDLERALKEPTFRAGAPAQNSAYRIEHKVPVQGKTAPQQAKAASQMRNDARNQASYSIPSGRPAGQRVPVKTPTVQQPPRQTTNAYTQRPVVQKPPAQQTAPVQSAANPQVQEQKKTPEKKNKALKLLLAIGIPALAGLMVLVMLIVFALPKLIHKRQTDTPVTENQQTDSVAATADEKPADVVLTTDEIIENLSLVRAGDVIQFGRYEQDNDLSNGKENIEWIVLEKEKDRLLVVSKDALDCQQFNPVSDNVTWETSSLRKWLNAAFLIEAFNGEEQILIPEVEVSADKNPKYSADPGNDTKDQVFLLSIVEVEQYFSDNDARKCMPTAYAIARGCYEFRDCCNWWTRSPGGDHDLFGCVHNDGSIEYDGNSGRTDDNGVRPALWIRLDLTEPVPEESTQDELSAAKAGDVIRFGYYEQDNDLENGKEAIEWIVLTKEEDRILVISRYGLDAQPYNETGEDSTWATCSIRQWLNGTFFMESFGARERTMIPAVRLVPDEDRYKDAEQGIETEDRVFLLSISEAEQYMTPQAERKCTPTAYAREQGVFWFDNLNTCKWWLRSAGFYSGLAVDVQDGGGILTGGEAADRKNVAVRPVIWIDLNA